jgi:hypothetical protein
MQDPVYNSVLFKNFLRMVQLSGNLEQIENKVYLVFSQIDVFLLFELVENFRHPIRIILSTKRYRKREVKITKVPTISYQKYQYYTSLKMFINFLPKGRNFVIRILNFFQTLPKFSVVNIKEIERVEFRQTRLYMHYRWI